MSSPEARPLRADELPRAAAFLARLNRIPEHHIGFCGTAEAEILDSLQQFSDVPTADAFVVLEQDGNLTGLLGFDADLGRGSAEIWGPFADPQADGAATALWHGVWFPAGIREALLFATSATSFARTLPRAAVLWNVLRHTLCEFSAAPFQRTLRYLRGL